MTGPRWANLTPRFGLELCALAALAFWPLQTIDPLLPRLGLALALPLLASLVWGRYIAPKATHPVGAPAWYGLQGVIFGCATASIAATGHPVLAAICALLVFLNLTLMALLGR